MPGLRDGVASHGQELVRIPVGVCPVEGGAHVAAQQEARQDEVACQCGLEFACGNKLKSDFRE